MARIVVAHLLHSFGGLDGNAARIERDALADQTEVIAGGGSFRRLIANHDQRGRLGAALRNAQ